jgi:hypothetical protein
MDLKSALMNLSARELKRAVMVKQRIDRLHLQLEAILAAGSPPPIRRMIHRRRRMSAAARAKIAAAARARWAKVRAGKKSN